MNSWAPSNASAAEVDTAAFKLPARFDDGSATDRTIIAEHDGLRAWAPQLSPAQLADVCRDLLDARHVLSAAPLDRIIAAIDAAARRLREPDGELRRDTLRALAAFTGYAPVMAAHVLAGMSADWLAPALHRLVAAELGGADAIDGFVCRADGTLVRAVAPPLGLHVFAGNVPGVSVTSMVRALLVRSAVLGKSAAGEPVLAPAFARALQEADPLVGACLAVTYWPGGDVLREAAVLRHARLVVHYGASESLASLRARAPEGTHFVEHGPRISFAVVQAAGGAPPPDAARDLANAVALFDQQGCVSPQLAYVIGAPAAARAFAAAVADALHDLAAELPRGRLQPAEAGAVHELRARAEFRAIAGEDVTVWAGKGLAFTVIFDPEPGFAGTCLNRTLLVKAAPSMEAVFEQVRPFGRYLQTVGIAGFDDDAAMRVAAGLGDAGATRITPLRRMPWPPVTWHHDGRGPLRELVRWVDLEQ
jgi:hypothetical protein